MLNVYSKKISLILEFNAFASFNSVSVVVTVIVPFSRPDIIVLETVDF
jgi:hypothetical protein